MVFENSRYATEMGMSTFLTPNRMRYTLQKNKASADYRCLFLLRVTLILSKSVIFPTHAAVWGFLFGFGKEVKTSENQSHQCFTVMG